MRPRRRARARGARRDARARARVRATADRVRALRGRDRRVRVRPTDAWIEVRGSGNDVFFRDPSEVETNAFVAVSSPSSSAYESVEDLGRRRTRRRGCWSGTSAS